MNVYRLVEKSIKDVTQKMTDKDDNKCHHQKSYSTVRNLGIETFKELWIQIYVRRYLINSNNDGLRISDIIEIYLNLIL